MTTFDEIWQMRLRVDNILSMPDTRVHVYKFVYRIFARPLRQIAGLF